MLQYNKTFILLQHLFYFISQEITAWLAQLYLANINKGIQSLDHTQRTMWKALRATNSAYYRPQHTSGLLFENNKHAIAKVRENANRHGGKNATITKWRHWWQLSENEKNNIQNTKYKSKVQKHRAL